MFTIPNIIHFIWIGSSSELIKHLRSINLRAWQKNAPDYNFMLWIDDRRVSASGELKAGNNMKLLNDHFKQNNFTINIYSTPDYFNTNTDEAYEFYELCVTSKNPAIAKDTITPFILRAFGGFQYDLKMIPLQPYPRNVQARHGFLIELTGTALVLKRMGATKNSLFMRELIKLHQITSQLILMTELNFNKDQCIKYMSIKLKLTYKDIDMDASEVKQTLSLVEEYVDESKACIGNNRALGAVFFNPNHIKHFKRAIGNYITGKVVTDLVAQHIKQAEAKDGRTFTDTSNFNYLSPKQRKQLAIPFKDKCLGSVELNGINNGFNYNELHSINCTTLIFQQLIEYLFLNEIRKEILTLVNTPRTTTGNGALLTLAINFFKQKKTAHPRTSALQRVSGSN